MIKDSVFVIQSTKHWQNSIANRMAVGQAETYHSTGVSLFKFEGCRVLTGWGLGGPEIQLMEDILHQLMVYPIIYKVLYIPGGAGFLPSTVLTWDFVVGSGCFILCQEVNIFLLLELK